MISLGSVLYGIVAFGCYVEDQYAVSKLAKQTLDIFFGGIKTNDPREDRHRDRYDSD